MSYLYKIYGINLAVPFQCPMLPLADENAIADVTVIENSVISCMASPMAEGHKWQASPGCFLFRGGPRSGKFLVEDGKRITFERNFAADDKVLCAHLLSSVMVALLRQRGMLILHASVIITPRGAIAISGESGSGKSTTQASLLRHGCRVVTDDVTVLQFGFGKEVVALPGIPKMNLCEDAAIIMGHDIGQLPRYPLRPSKVVISLVSDEMTTKPVSLKAVYHLSTHSGKDLKTTYLEGADKLNVLQNCIYGPLLPSEHPDMFSLMTSLMKQADIVNLERPSAGWSVNKVVEAILHG